MTGDGDQYVRSTCGVPLEQETNHVGKATSETLEEACLRGFHGDSTGSVRSNRTAC